METAIDASISFVKWEEDGEVGYTIFLGEENGSGIMKSLKILSHTFSTSWMNLTTSRNKRCLNRVTLF